MTDLDIVARIVQIQRPLFAYVLALLPQAQHAEEILQNTNQRILAERDRWPEIVDFDAWARRLAYFEFLAYRKSLARERARLEPSATIVELADAAFARAAAPDDRLGALEHCLARLGRRERALIDARYGRPASVAELARETRQSAGAVRQALYRIRRQLLACIDRRLADAEALG